VGRKTWLMGKAYLESDVWRCPKAPINPDIGLQVTNQTGAHYWIQMDQTEKLAGGHYFMCRYCNDITIFPIRFSRGEICLG